MIVKAPIIGTKTGSAFLALTYLVAGALNADGATLLSYGCLDKTLRAYQGYAYHPATFYAYELLIADGATIASLTCLDQKIKEA